MPHLSTTYNYWGSLAVRYLALQLQLPPLLGFPQWHFTSEWTPRRGVRVLAFPGASRKHDRLPANSWCSLPQTKQGCLKGKVGLSLDLVHLINQALWNSVPLCSPINTFDIVEPGWEKKWFACLCWNSPISVQEKNWIQFQSNYFRFPNTFFNIRACNYNHNLNDIRYTSFGFFWILLGRNHCTSHHWGSIINHPVFLRDAQRICCDPPVKIARDFLAFPTSEELLRLSKALWHICFLKGLAAKLTMLRICGLNLRKLQHL